MGKREGGREGEWAGGREGGTEGGSEGGRVIYLFHLLEGREGLGPVAGARIMIEQYVVGDGVGLHPALRREGGRGGSERMEEGDYK